MSSEAGRGVASFDRYMGTTGEGGGACPEDPGTYEDLDAPNFASKSQHVSGSTSVEELSVEEFSSSGSVHVSGEARTRNFQSSGSATLGSDLISRIVNTSGSFRLHGKGVVAEMTTSGSAVVEGGLHVRDHLRVSGSVKVPWIDSTGVVEVSGHVEAGDLSCKDLFLVGGGSAAAISASQVSINVVGMRGFGRLLGIWFGPKHRSFHAESITSKGTVSLDMCEVHRVRGDVVQIGKRSHVGKVTYVTRCDVEAGATLDEPPVKVMS